MDRPRHRTEPIEPNRPSDSPPTPGTPADPAASDAFDRRPDPEAHSQQGLTGSGDRTVEERSMASDESGEDSTGSSRDARQDGVADRSVAKPADDAADALREPGRDDADTTAISESADDSTSTVRDVSDQLPANLREEMLRDPRFTRLGWGTGDHSDSEQDDDIDPSEQVEVRPSETEDSPPPDQPDAAQEADAELTEAEETAVDERVSDPTHHESSEAAAEGDDTGQAREDVDQNHGTDDVAAALKLDTGVNGEPIKARFDRWDPERIAMSRPPKPEVSMTSDVQTDELSEASDRRAEDVRNGVAYIAAHQDSRPWLAPAANCEPMVQSVYASIDLSDGHGHIRHGAMGADELQARRVAFNEDPAQRDPEKRALGIDGIDPTKQHYCGRDSTRIHDATALAAVYVMASEHPDVRAALDQPFDSNMQPRDILVPIVELLGPNGHEFCSGFTLNGWPEAKAARKEWLQAMRAGADVSDLPAPDVARIPTFEGGDIKIVFKRNPETQTYGIYTLFPRPFEE